MKSVSIEFDCPNCDSFLRAGNDKAGLRIRCPACQAPVWVPFLDAQNDLQQQTSHRIDSQPSTSISTAAFPEDIEELDDADLHWESENQEFSAKGTQIPEEVTVGGIVRESWRIYSENFSACLVASALDLVANAIAIVLAFVVAVMTFVALQGLRDLAFLAAAAVWLLGMMIVWSAISAKNCQYYLAMARGAPSAARFRRLKKLDIGRILLAWLFFWTIAGLGLLMCVVPGLVAVVLLWPFVVSVIDRDTSVAVAIRHAISITSRRPGVAAGACALHLLLLVIVSLVPIIGKLLGQPLAEVLHSVSYLHLTSEPAEAVAAPVSLHFSEPQHEAFSKMGGLGGSNS